MVVNRLELNNSRLSDVHIIFALLTWVTWTFGGSMSMSICRFSLPAKKLVSEWARLEKTPSNRLQRIPFVAWLVRPVALDIMSYMCILKKCTQFGAVCFTWHSWDGLNAQACIHRFFLNQALIYSLYSMTSHSSFGFWVYDVFINWFKNDISTGCISSPHDAIPLGFRNCLFYVDVLTYLWRRYILS